MHSRKVSPSLLQLLVTLICPQVGRPSPVATIHPSTDTQSRDFDLRLRDSTSPSATVVNNCPFPIYLWSVADGSSPCQTLAANGGTFSQAYQQRGSGGISLKIARNETLSGSISQLEYTVVPDGPYVGVFWDLSHVNGQPFLDHGEQVVPTVMDGGGSGGDGTCQMVMCTAGQVCQDAYNRSNDDQATHECPLETELLYTLCSGGTDTGEGGSTQAQSQIQSQLQGQATTATDLPTISIPAAISTQVGQGQEEVQTSVVTQTTVVTTTLGGGLSLAWPTAGGQVEELKT